MKRPEMLLFDYGETLLHSTGFDTLRGTRAVLQYAEKNPENVSAEEVQVEAARHRIGNWEEETLQKGIWRRSRCILIFFSSICILLLESGCGSPMKRLSGCSGMPRNRWNPRQGYRNFFVFCRIQVSVLGW